MTASAALATASAASMDGAARGELRDFIKRAMEKSLVKGDTWYLCDVRWFAQLKKYLGLSDAYDPKGGGDQADIGDPSAHPGHIDLSGLFQEGDPSAELREHMVTDMDYTIMPESAWDKLVEAFGLTGGQKPVARKVIDSGMFVKHCKIEVYFMELKLAENSTINDVRSAKFSRNDTLGDIEDEMRRLFDVPEDINTRLWNKYSGDTLEHLSKPEQTVQEAGLFESQLLVLEKQIDGKWQRKTVMTGRVNGAKKESSPGVSNVVTATENANISSSSSSSAPAAPPLPPPVASAAAPTTTGAVEKLTPGPSAAVSTRYNFGSYGDGGQSDKAQPGLCGLSNLGNTCFMNSIIQGLSNCPPITEYFANDNYPEDINEDNPLGMQGEIARTFGELIKSIWSGRYSYVVPRNFKMAVGRFAPQFSGYQQQDSQELLTFLLDGLHEDLNRIKKKPYIELKDSTDRHDDEVAGEAWDIYKKRNDSVILDLFHGLLKSTVVCPECPKVSVTFDPFCHLSLPLPVKKERKIEVFLVYEDRSKPPKQYKVTVAKSGSMNDLCVALEQMCGISNKMMVVTDVYNHRFHKIYGPDESLTHILDRDDIFIYEVPAADDPNHVIVAVYLREKKSSLTYSPSNLFGQPLLVGVPAADTDYEQLYEIVLKSLSRYVTVPEPSEEWWKKQPNAEMQNGVDNAAAHTATNGEAAATTNGETTALGEAAAATTNGEAAAAENDVKTAEDTSDDTTPSSADGLPPSPLSDAADGAVNSTAAAAKTEPSTTLDDDMMVEDEEEDDKRGPPKLFAMNLVNSYGNAQIESFANDGAPLKMTQKSFISLDWSARAKELFYNEKAAEEFAQDQSFELKSAQKKQVRLEECLELYTNKEKLGENDAWFCPNCKKHQQATKKFDLWSLPCMLVISLKRFSYNRYWRDKLDSPVEFPTRGLDMSPYVINQNHGPAVYDLVAVSNHYGGMGGGHYTAYAKNKDDSNWYYFDDSNVSPSSEDAVVTKAAYVLFYQRRDISANYKREPSSSSSAAAASASAVCNGNGVPTAGAAAATAKVNGDASSVEDMDIN